MRARRGIDANRLPAPIYDSGAAQATQSLMNRMSGIESSKGYIGAGAVGSSSGTIGDVDGGNIIANTITAASIKAGAITALAIAAGELTAYIINGNDITLSSAVVNTNKVLMNVNGITTYDGAGNITAKLSSGDGSFGLYASSTGSAKLVLGQLYPGTSGARVVLDSSGIKGYNASNTQEFTLDATTGILSCTAVIQAISGSSLPVSTIVGDLPGSANRYSGSAFQDGQGSFTTNTSLVGGTQYNWVGNACTISDGGTTVPPVYGARTAKIVSSGASPYISDNYITDPYKHVLPGLNYTLSHYVWPATATRQSYTLMKWYDASGTAIGSTTGTAISCIFGQWTRVSNTFQAPANAQYGVGWHYVSNGDGVTGDIFYVECLQMEQGDRASAWGPRPDEILYYSINANMIQARSITADKLVVTSLDAISANLGSIVSGTITSATVQSNSNPTNGGILLNASGLFGYASGGSQIFSLGASGLTVTGAVNASSGSISGTLTVSGLIQTSFPSPKVAFGSFGVRAYDSLGNITVNINAADGSITALKGTIGGLTINNTSLNSTYFNMDSVGNITNHIHIDNNNLPSPSLIIGQYSTATYVAINCNNAGYGQYNAFPYGHVFQVNGSTAFTITQGRLSFADGMVIDMGTAGSFGVTLGTAAQKMAFFGGNPVGQQNNTNPGGFVDPGTGNAVHFGFTSTGGVGSTAYTFNGIVNALKNLGLIAS